jgi:hypothetical protein
MDLTKIATSKNLTLFGIATLLGTLAVAAKALFDGDPATNPDWNATAAGIGVAITAILSKGQANTGGTVASTPEAVSRVALGTPKGFAQPWLLLGVAIAGVLMLGLSGCAAIGGTSGSTGRVQLSDKVACTPTLGVRDPATCAQAITLACEVPEPKGADGTCTLIGLDTGSISLGKGYSTHVSVAQSPTPCVAIVTSSWTVPSGKLVGGACQ